MFESLLQWCTIPVSIRKAGTRNAAGDITYSSPVEYMCYMADELHKIVDKTGKEYVSGTQIYLPADVPVELSDQVILRNTDAPRDIRKIGGYFDGGTGKLSISVVYL